MAVKHRRCVVCCAEQAQRLFRPGQSPGPVVRCENCSMVYVSPIEDDRALIDEGPVIGNDDVRLLTSSDLKDLEGSWELALLPGKEKEWPALRINAFQALDHIERHVDQRRRILDFGCGWGFFLGAAQERGWEPYGLEPLSGSAIYARARFQASVVTDVLREDTFAENFFDAIATFQVFEHLPDPADALQKLKRFLRPGGVIFIEVPNIDTWSVRLFRHRHRHFVQDHLNFFSRATLSELLRRQGFEVIGAHYPTRHMTLRHLAVDWGAKFLPSRLASGVQRAVGNRLNQVIPLNFGDILAVMARKPLAILSH